MPVKAGLPLSRGSRALLYDLALELERPRRKLGVLGLEQEGVEAAAMVDGLERIGGHPQPHAPAEHVRHQRDIEQVGLELPLGLAVGVAHFMTDLTVLAGELATPCHGSNSLQIFLAQNAFSLPRRQVAPAQLWPPTGQWGEMAADL